MPAAVVVLLVVVGLLAAGHVGQVTRDGQVDEAATAMSQSFMGSRIKAEATAAAQSCRAVLKKRKENRIFEE